MPETTPLGILQGARKLLEDPKAWIKLQWATNAEGEPVGETDDKATCFCLGDY